MKIILKKEYELLGSIGQILEVKNGYARNYLIPNGIAVLANESSLKSYEEIKRQKSKKVQKLIDEAQSSADKLSGVVLTIPVKSSDEDKIFGSVTSQMIYEHLLAKGFQDIDRKKIVLKEPIKTLGEHEVEMKLQQNVVAKFRVNVINEFKEENTEQAMVPEESKITE
jgi:large subunit ribosomal protein L9